MSCENNDSQETRQKLDSAPPNYLYCSNCSLNVACYCIVVASLKSQTICQEKNTLLTIHRWHVGCQQRVYLKRVLHQFIIALHNLTKNNKMTQTRLLGRVHRVHMNLPSLLVFTALDLSDFRWLTSWNVFANIFRNGRGRRGSSFSLDDKFILSHLIWLPLKWVGAKLNHQITWNRIFEILVFRSKI